MDKWVASQGTSSRSYRTRGEVSIIGLTYMCRGMAAISPPCPKCKDGLMVKDRVKGWHCPKCGYAPFIEEHKSTPAPSPPPSAMPVPAQFSAAPPSAGQPLPPSPGPSMTVGPAPRLTPPLPSPVEPAPRTLFQYPERQAYYDRQSWVEAGKGLRFSRIIPLSVLPPGEPVKMQVLVLNAGNAPIAATYYVSLTNPNMQGMRLSGETMDIPPGYVFDVLHAITTTFLPGDYSLTLFCLPHPPSSSPGGGRPAPTGAYGPGASPLMVMDGSIPPGLPGLYGVFRVRTALTCPNCRGALIWVQDGTGGKPRAWVCGRCGFRLESGML